MRELRVERKENMAGGRDTLSSSTFWRERIKRKVQDVCRSYTGALGCSLGYHEHHNESETYYILRGKEIMMTMDVSAR